MFEKNHLHHIIPPPSIGKVVSPKIWVDVLLLHLLAKAAAAHGRTAGPAEVEQAPGREGNKKADNADENVQPYIIYNQLFRNSQFLDFTLKYRV